jgi:phage baseplate assembly protein W
MTRRLAQERYLAFPLRLGEAGADTCGRVAHVEQQVLQTLLTNPRERVFRPDFGAGLNAALFEPNGTSLATMTRERLSASLAEALSGEVDPRTLQVEVTQEGEELRVSVGYRLAALNVSEHHEFIVKEGAHG